MPKLKSHSGAKKRFRVTGSGKVKYAKGNRGHFLTEKSASKKRKLRKGAYFSGKQAKNIKRMINAWGGRITWELKERLTLIKSVELY